MAQNDSIFSALEVACRRNPSGIALSNEHKALPFTALLSQTAAIADVFRKSAAPLIVYIALPSGPDFTALQFGLMAAGSIAVPIPNKLTPYEASTYFGTLPPDVVCLPSVSEGKAIVDSLPDEAGLVFSNGAPAQWTHMKHPCVHLDDITACKAIPIATTASSRILPRETRMVQFTSGTTGLPKAILLTEANIMGNQSANADHLHPFAGRHFLCPIPQYHAMGNAVVFEHLLSGSPIHLANSFLHGEHLNRMTTYRCAGMLASPNYFRMLLKAKRFDPGSLPHLTFLTIGTDWIDRGLLLDLRNRFPGVTLYCRYGLSEAVGPVAYHTIAPGQTLSAEGALGNLMPGIEMKKIPRSPDAAGSSAPLRIKSVSAAKWQLAPDTGITSLTDGEGFLNTGDLVRRGPDGQLTIVGRETQFIKVNGFRVNPYEIEELLRQVSGIRDAVVVGVPDPSSGQRLVACLDPEANCPSAKDIMAFCLAHLSPYKVPTRFLTDLSIPKTGTGKPARHRLARIIETCLTDNPRV